MKHQPTVYLMLSLAIAISTLWLSQSQGYSTGQLAPEITNDTWVNSAPLRLTDLRGKVVLVEFWTFGCYNCQNVEPYVQELARQIQRPRVSRYWGTLAGVQSRARSQKRLEVCPRTRHPVCSSYRQRLQDLEQLPESLLAGNVSNRQARGDSQHSNWRGRL